MQLIWKGHSPPRFAGHGNCEALCCLLSPRCPQVSHVSRTFSDDFSLFSVVGIGLLLHVPSKCFCAFRGFDSWIWVRLYCSSLLPSHPQTLYSVVSRVVLFSMVLNWSLIQFSLGQVIQRRNILRVVDNASFNKPWTMAMLSEGCIGVILIILLDVDIIGEYWRKHTNTFQELTLCRLLINLVEP